MGNGAYLVGVAFWVFIGVVSVAGLIADHPAAAILAAWFMPSVLQSTATAMRVAGEYSESVGALIISPAGWSSRR